MISVPIDTYVGSTLDIVFNAEDYNRVQWLSKDLGYPSVEKYIHKALAFYRHLTLLKKSGHKLYFGQDMRQSKEFDFPYYPECLSHASYGIRIRIEEDFLEGIDNLSRFIWSALFCYYDLYVDNAVDKTIFHESGSGYLTQFNWNKYVYQKEGM